MRKLTSIMALAALTTMAQTANSPSLSGTSSVLAWDANPPEDGVTQYNIYANGVRVASSQTNQIPISMVLTANGTYTILVTAVNPAGESLPSTNIVDRHWANKPLPPKGLLVK